MLDKIPLLAMTRVTSGLMGLFSIWPGEALFLGVILLETSIPVSITTDLPDQLDDQAHHLWQFLWSC